jgi:hypothetical protein
LLWIVGIDFLTLWALSLVLLELPLVGGVAVLLLSLSIERLLGVGNVDGIVLVGMIGAWHYRDRPGIAGTILGVLVTLKLTPAFLVVLALVNRSAACHRLRDRNRRRPHGIHLGTLK